jgi:hypothetical protein
MKYSDNKKPAVLLLGFCRADNFIQVAERVGAAGVNTIYVALDGPRDGRPGDIDNLNRIKAFVDQMEKGCIIHRLYREHNLGCARAVSEAITWFLDDCEEGIILEDDCLPDVSFFSYCAQMLDHYRHDTRIMQIAGFNKLSGSYLNDKHYFFSQVGWCWGWATWKRAWALFDPEMKALAELEHEPFMLHYPFGRERVRRFKRICDAKMNSWYYPWGFSFTINHGLTVVPCHSLVQNTGIKSSRSVSNGKAQPVHKIETTPFPLPIQFHSYVFPNTDYDKKLIRSSNPRYKRILRILLHVYRKLI